MKHDKTTAGVDLTPLVRPDVVVTLAADKDLPEATANALGELARLAAEQLARGGFEDENRWFGPDAPT